jgi:GNAT superfamily N-acetyltransferase
VGQIPPGADNRLRVWPFSDVHVPAAASLLSEVQRVGSAGLTSVVADLREASRALCDARERGLGVTAVEGSDVAGFLIAPLPPSPAHGGVRITDVHHAATPERARFLYRTMYEALAGRLVRLGVFTHRILVLAEPTMPVTALFEMGFGVDQIKGVRPVEAGLAPHIGCLVERASIDDVDDVVDLWIELDKFHSRSPILGPAMPDPGAIRAEAAERILDQARVVLVARESGRAVAMIEAHPDGRYADTVTIGLNVVTEAVRSGGIGTAMLDALLRWASITGFRHCAVSWASANLISDAFYRARGFLPIRYELVRHLDPRIAWANQTRDHHAFSSS